MIANSHSQAQWHIAPATANPKHAIELVCLPPLTLPTLKKTKSFKDRENVMSELKNNLKPLTDKNAQLVTRGIFYCRVSANIKVFSSLETLYQFDSDILRNRQQKHTAIRYGQGKK